MWWHLIEVHVLPAKGSQWVGGWIGHRAGPTPAFSCTQEKHAIGDIFRSRISTTQSEYRRHRHIQAQALRMEVADDGEPSCTGHHTSLLAITTRAREVRCGVVYCYISPPNHCILDARSVIVVMHLPEDGSLGTGTQRRAEGVNCPHLPPSVPYQLVGVVESTGGPISDPIADMCGSC
jgi:hypothetical protein